MELKLTLTNLENCGPIDDSQIKKFEQIFTTLIQTGGLSGVKSGKTILHFDKFGLFRGVQLDYWPYENRA